MNIYQMTLVKEIIDSGDKNCTKMVLSITETKSTCDLLRFNNKMGVSADTERVILVQHYIVC